MEQHPIPQQISSYQFKLVGDMTLKQFFQLAGGVVISLIFYSLPLHFLIKWPLIIISAGLGAAMAFVPFQERPLERWILAFFRSIYSPTLYFWKKADKPYVFFSESTATPPVTNSVAGQTVAEPNAKKFEDAEKNFLSKLTSLFSNNSQPSTTNNQTNSGNQVANTMVQSSDVEKVVADKLQETGVQNISKVQVTSNQPPAKVSVPQQIPTVVTKTAPKIVIEEMPSKNSNQVETTKIEGLKLKENQILANPAEFSIDAAPPAPPSTVNTITGQVMDEARKIIEGAIMEIKDSNSRPVRALKSNKAGHFIIVTPLTNGKYEISVEKDGYTFEPVSFEAKGEIIPPIAIRGVRI